MGAILLADGKIGTRQAMLCRAWVKVKGMPISLSVTHLRLVRDGEISEIVVSLQN